MEKHTIEDISRISQWILDFSKDSSKVSTYAPQTLPVITEFTDRSQALLSVTATNYFFQFSKVDFISNENQIKLVLYGMSPKIAIFCSISVCVSFFELSKTQKRIHGASWAVPRNVTLGI